MIVGSAEVKIVANTTSLVKDIQAQLKNLDKTGERAGKSIGNEMGRAMADAFRVHLDKVDQTLDTKLKLAGKKSGRTFGDAFNKEAGERINLLLREVNFAAVGGTAAVSMADGFEKKLDLKKPVERQFASIASEAHTWGNKIGDNLSKGANKRIQLDSGGFRSAGGRAGAEFGGAFVQSVRNFINQGTAAPFEGFILGIVKNFLQLSLAQSVIYGVVAALSDLVNGVISLAAATSEAIPALAGLGNVFSAFLQGMGVFSALFKGIPQAMQALEQVQKRAAQSSEDLLARLLKIAQARLGLRQAILGQVRAEEDARERIEDATEAHSDALREEARAQLAVSEARKAAQERLEDLTLALEDASLSEERAVLNLKKAEKALAEARAGGNVNAIYEADLAYRETEFSLRQLQESNGDLKDESEAAFAAGVEGSREVVDAQEAYKDSIDATNDALQELQRAIQDFPLTMEESSLRVQQAILSLMQALKPERASDATFKALTDAMNELSPAAQDFVRFWKGKVSPLLLNIKKAGQEKFFPGLQSAIQKLLDSRFDEVIAGMFTGTASALGNFMEQLATSFTADDTMLAMEKIFKSNIKIIKTLGDTAAALVRPFAQIGAALTGIGEGFADTWLRNVNTFNEWINKLNSEKVKIVVQGPDMEPQVKEVSRLEAFFIRSREALASLWEMVKAFGPGFRAVFDAALPAGRYLVEAIRDMGTAWSDSFTETKKGDMAATFLASAKNAEKLLALVGDLLGFFFRMGGNDGVGRVTDAFIQILPQVERFASAGWDQIADDIAQIVLATGDLIEAFGNSQVLEVFFEVLSGVFSAITGVIKGFSEFEGSFLGIEISGAAIIGALTAALGLYKALSLILRLTLRVGLGFVDGVGKGKSFFGAVASGAKKTLGFFGSMLSATFHQIQAWRRGRKAAKEYYQNREAQRGFPGSDKGFGGRLARYTDPDYFETGRRVRKQAREDYKNEQQVGRRVKTLDEVARGIEKEQADYQKRIGKVGKKLGFDLSGGVEEGVKAGLADLGITSEAEIREAIAYVRRAIEAHSPSLLTKRLIGIPMGEGVEEGFKAGFNGQEVAASVTAETKGSLAAAVPSMAGNGRLLGDAFAEGFDSATGATMVSDMTRETRVASTGAALSMAGSGRLVGNAFAEGFDSATGASMISDATREAKAASLVSGLAFAGMGAQDGLAYASGFDSTANVGGLDADLDIDRKGRKGGRAGRAGRVAESGTGKGGFLSRFFRKGGGEAVEEGVEAAGKKALGGALAKLGAKAAAKQAIGSVLPGIGNIIAALWTVVDVIFLIKDFGPEISAAFTKAFADVRTYWDETFWPWLTGVGATISGWWNGLWTFLGGAWSRYVAQPFFRGVDSLKTKFNSFVEELKGKWRSFTNFFANPVENTKNMFLNLIRKPWNSLVDGINQYIIPNFNKIPFLPDLKLMSKIPQYEEGGLVGGRYVGRDSELALLTPGEYVLTRDMVSAFGTSRLEAMRRGGGSLDASDGGGSSVLSSVLSFAFERLFRLLRGLPAMDTIAGKLERWYKDHASYGDSWANRIMGGLPGFARGGPVKGRYRGTDTMMAKLTPGEYVLPRAMVRAIGLSRLESMRNGRPRSGGLYNDIPFAEGLTQKEIERLLKYFKEQEKYKYLDIPKYEDLFKEFLSKAIEAQYTQRTAAYSSATAKQALERNYRNMFLNGESWLLPPYPGMNDVLKAYPDLLFESTMERINRGLTPEGALKGPLPINVDPAVQKDLASQIVLSSAFENSIFGVYLQEKARRVAEEAQRELEALIARSDAGISGYMPDPPLQDPERVVTGPPKSSNKDPNGFFIRNSGRLGYLAKATGRQWRFPLDRYFPGKTFPGHRPQWGWDVASPAGIGAIAVQDGVVSAIGNRGRKSYGQYVFLDHHDGTRSVYAHLSFIDPKLKKKMKIWAGAQFGRSGFTGGVRPPGSRGAHLHYELWRPGRPNSASATLDNMRGRGVYLRGKDLMGNKGRAFALAKGGVLAATPGGIPAILAEGGRSERVTPLDSKGRSSAEVELLEMVRDMLEKNGPTYAVTQNIYPAPGMDERMLAQKVSREIGALKRRRS